MKINTVNIQPFLISGTNLKTPNGNNLKGSGNVNINSAMSQLKYTLINPTFGSPVTGLTSLIASSALIPANTFTSDGILNLVCRLNKLGTTSNWTIRIYKNTINSFTGAIVIATIGSPLSSSIIYSECVRCFRLTGGTLKYMTQNQASLTDTFATGTVESSTTFNLSVNNYIIVGITLFNTGADTATTSFLQILGYE